MAQTVLVSNLMMLKEQARFEKIITDRGYDLMWATPEQFLTEGECLEYMGQVDGWLCGDDQITRAVISRGRPRLKALSKWGTGLDSIDLQAASDLGVIVSNTRGAFSQPVAEVALYFFLSLSRKLTMIDRHVRAKHWPKPQGRELSGQALGLVGMGAIGRRIAELATAFGMTVRFYDPMLNEPVKLPLARAKPASLVTLAQESDILCLACNYSQENYHMINADILSVMKQEAFLVNVARGPLVDEAALVTALQTGQIAGAGLDVFEVEPLPSDSPLRHMDQIVLCSHNANNGLLAVEEVHQNTLNNLFVVLDAYK